MRTGSIALVSLLCAALASPAFADNGKGRGNGNGNGNSHGNAGGAARHDNDRDNDRGNDHGDNKGRNDNGPAFDRRAVVPYQQIVVIDRDRDLVHTYYRNEYRAGRCPPGLAKKNNGCLPPGQVGKTWRVGQSLPPDVVYYPIRRELWTQLTPPPYGYEYVQVDNDIVLISTVSRVIGALLGNVGRFD